MSSNVVFRRYEPGDEDGIVSTLNACFSTFREFELNKDIWLGYSRMDQGFKTENALVAENEGRIVGHVQVVHRKVRVGEETYITMGGIANVSTIPEMRGRGISTTLMANAIDLCRQEGIPLSGLFTGYGSPAHRIYRRVGYGNTMLCGTGMVGAFDEMTKVKEYCNEVSGVRVRHYEHGDEEGMLDVYRDWCREYTGVTERNLEYWRKKLVDRSSTQTFFYDEFDPSEVFVASEHGKVTGYAYVTLWKNKKKPCRPPDTASIREIVFKPGHVKSLIMLVNVIMDAFLSEEIKVCETFIPTDQIYSTIFKPFMRMAFGSSSDCIYMVHVPLIDKFFHEMKEDLERRLSLRPDVASNMILEFKTPYGNVMMKVHGGELSFHKDQPSASIFFDECCFTKMIFGIETMDDFINGDVIRMHTSEPVGKVVSLVRALFPKRTWFVCPIDHW